MRSLLNQTLVSEAVNDGTVTQHAATGHFNTWKGRDGVQVSQTHETMMQLWGLLKSWYRTVLEAHAQMHVFSLTNYKELKVDIRLNRRIIKRILLMNSVECLE